MSSRKRAIVTGMIATYPVGGVVWDYGQYLLGLEDIGFDVWYLEDTGGPTYDPTVRRYGSDCSYAIRFLADSLTWLSPTLADRWAFRDEFGDLHGMSEQNLLETVATADLFLNVSGGTLLRDLYMKCGCKVLIDSDPGWNHYVNYPKWDANPGWQETHGFRAHDFHFTYAERLGESDCLLPDLGIEWLPTRPLVSVDRWQATGAGREWTTVMTWNNFRKPVEYDGRVYGTKECEFEKIAGIPALRKESRFELAVGGTEAPVDEWRDTGWNVVDAETISATSERYQDYLQSSRGELSVAKNLYVATRSGWFSCRSICYLAASRPVVVQDTGFSHLLPTGEGLCAFRTAEEAIAGVDRVESDYARHQKAAREIAAEYFDARRVLLDMLIAIGIE